MLRLDGGSSLGVQGSLLTAQSTSFRVGDPTNTSSSFLGIFDGSSLEQTGASGAPLLLFDASTVDSAGALVSVGRSPSTGNPSRLALDGPLFRAVNGTRLTMAGDALGISDGGQFTGGSASAALITLDNAQLTTGPSSGSVLQVGGFGADGVTPATANLGGALLNAGAGSALNLTGGFIQASSGGQVNVDPGVTNSLITLHGGSHTLGGSAIGIFSGGQFTGGSASAALIDLDNAQLTGARSVLEVDGVGGATGGTPATANLRGALLNAGPGSSLNLTGGFIQASSGGQVNVAPGATNSLITLHGGSHTLGASAIGVLGGGQFTGGSASAALIGLDNNAALSGAGSVLRADGVGGATGGTPATANLGGALLNAASGSTLNLSGGVIQAANGGQVIVDPSVTTSLITLHGGSHTLGPSAIGVSTGGQFTGGSASAPLIELDNAQLAGLTSVLQVGGFGADGVTPARANLGGALLNAGTGSPLSLTGGFIQVGDGGQVNVAPGATTSLIPLHGGTHTLGGDAIGVFNGGQFTGGSASAALIGLDNSAVLSGARSVLRADGVGGATGGTPATATLAGALLNAASGSTLNLSGGVIQAANGGQVTVDPGVTTPLITLHGGSHTSLGGDAISIMSGGQFTGGSASAALIELDNAQLTGFNSVLQVRGFGADGGTPARANLGGALLNAGTGSPLSLTGGFIQAANGGQVIVAPGATTSLITLHGGSHTLGPSAIGVFNGGQFTGGSASAPLIELDNAQLTGLTSVLQVGGFGADGVTPATATLGGALLNAGTGSPLSLTGGFIQASSGGQVIVDPGATTSLITLHGGSHTLGPSAIGVSNGGQFTGGSASAALIESRQRRGTVRSRQCAPGGWSRGRHRGDPGHGDPGRSPAQRRQWEHPESHRGVHPGGQRWAGDRGSERDDLADHAPRREPYSRPQRHRRLQRRSVHRGQCERRVDRARQRATDRGRLGARGE